MGGLVIKKARAGLVKVIMLLLRLTSKLDGRLST